MFKNLFPENQIVVKYSYFFSFSQYPINTTFHIQKTTFYILNVFFVKKTIPFIGYFFLFSLFLELAHYQFKRGNI